MTPDHETIARMEARGWTWRERSTCPGLMYFESRSDQINLIVTVWWDANTSSGWCWSSNHAWSRTRSTLTPDLAADEAEAWLRGVLSELRFPWLRVGP